MHATNDIMVIEQKISELETRYKQKKQKLEQLKSVLVTKDKLHTSNKTPNKVTGQSCDLISIVALQTMKTLVPRQKCAPLIK